MVTNSHQARPAVPSELSVERHIEIACDESGFSGGNLVGRGHSPVFAHASIRIAPETAVELIRDLRRNIGARGESQSKSAEILRPRRRPALLWLLQARAVRSMATRTFTSLTPDSSCWPAWSTYSWASSKCRRSGFPGRDSPTRRMSLALYRFGEQSYGTSRWQEFLTLSANLFRTDNRWLPQTPVQTLYA